MHSDLFVIPSTLKTTVFSALQYVNQLLFRSRCNYVSSRAKVNLSLVFIPPERIRTANMLKFETYSGLGSFSCCLVLPPFLSDNSSRDLAQYIYRWPLTLSPPARTGEQNHPRAEDDWLAVPPDRMRLSFTPRSPRKAALSSRSPSLFPRARLMHERRGRQTPHIGFHLKERSCIAPQ